MALSIKAAAYIVTIALIGTIFLAAVDIHQEPTTVTTYEQVTDLTPLVVYEDVDSYKPYNPPKNVTGWQNVTYQTQSTPTQYVAVLEPTNKTTESRINTSLVSNAVWIALDETNQYRLTDGTEWYSINAIPEGMNAVGGGPISTFANLVYVQLNGTGLAGQSEYAYVINLNLYGKTLDSTKTLVVTTTDAYRCSNGDMSVNYAHSTNRTVMNFVTSDGRSYTPDVGVEYGYDRATDSFYKVSGYTEINDPVLDYNSPAKTIFVIQNAESLITYDMYTRGTYSYVRSYTFVDIAAGETAVWSNGYNNGMVQLVVEPGAHIKAGSRLFTAPAAVNSYPYMLVTINDATQEYYAQGITSSNPDLANVSTVGYRYDLTVAPIGPTVTLQPNYTFIPPRHFIPQFDPESDGEQIVHSEVTILPPDFLTPQLASVTVHGDNTTIDGLTVRVSDLTSDVVIQYAQDPLNINPLILHVTGTYTPDSDVSRLEVSHTTKAYVMNTMIPSDPLGLLWKNPTISVSDYFPDLFNTGARVMISGYTTAGDSVTVNGQTFPVTNGYVEIEGGSYPVKGMAIDYKGGHTYLVFTQNNNRTFDLGETVTTASTFWGVWYFSSALDSIRETVKDTTQVTIGQGAIDQNTVIFVFVSLLIVGALIGSYFIRGGISPIDWLIILVAGAFALVMVS